MPIRSDEKIIYKYNKMGEILLNLFSTNL